ncbi:MAG: hypothetical protein ACE5DM_01015 [Candidatus Nanoarchaeia archaeon]
MRHKIWLISILAVILAVRLFFVFQAPTMSLDSYFSVRQVGSILETGSPILEDPLSYSGRLNIISPMYYYVLSGFALIVGENLALKILPSLFITLFAFIIYLLAKTLTENENISLLTAFFSGFIPAFFLNTLNSATPLTVVLPLFFLCIYLFFHVSKEIYLYAYVICVFILGLVSPLSFLFVLGLIIFLFLTKLEYKKQSWQDIELALFSIFLLIWLQVLFYKKAFLFHGFSVVLQNLPVGLLSGYFRDIRVIDAVYAVGLIPLFLGIFTVYKYTLKEKNRQIYFLVAFALATGMVLWLKLIPLNTGLVFLGSVLIVLASQSFKLFFAYFANTKASRWKLIVWIGVIVVFAMTSIMPSLSWAASTMQNAPGSGEIAALEWIGENVDKDSVVLTSVQEGAILNAIAKRKNVADTNFILIKDVDRIYDDVENMFTTRLETNAVELTDKYGVNYIYFSPRTKELYSIEDIPYRNERCFETVYDKEVKIYRVRCHVKNA